MSPGEWHSHCILGLATRWGAGARGDARRDESRDTPERGERRELEARGESQYACVQAALAGRGALNRVAGTAPTTAGAEALAPMSVLVEALAPRLWLLRVLRPARFMLHTCRACHGATSEPRICISTGRGAITCTVAIVFF